MERLPKANVIEQDGNIFNILGISRKALKEAGVSLEVSEEMSKRVQSAESYEDALNIMQEYVEFV